MSKQSALAFTCLLISIMWARPNVLLGQSETWQSKLTSHHVVATVNMNLGRLCESFADTEAREKVSEFLAKRKGLNIDQIDQFQFYFLRDPNLKLGADDNSYTQLTLNEPLEFDAKAVGKMTGYQLTESELGQWQSFLSDKGNRGAWGAIQTSDRSLLFGVPRTLNSIIASQNIEFPEAHRTDGLRKQDVDLCITIAGGKPIAEIFANAWNTNQYAPTFELLDRGLIYFDAESETPLVANFKATNAEAAKQLADEIAKLLQLGSGSIDSYLPLIARELKGLKAVEDPGIKNMVSQYQAIHDALEAGKETLKLLEVSVDGENIKVVCKGNESLKKLIEAACGILFN